jgi:hypothetical protein
MEMQLTSLADFEIVPEKRNSEILRTYVPSVITRVELTHGLKYNSSRSIVPSDIASFEPTVRASGSTRLSIGLRKAATASLNKNVAGPP